MASYRRRDRNGRYCGSSEHALTTDEDGPPFKLEIKLFQERRRELVPFLPWVFGRFLRRPNCWSNQPDKIPLFVGVEAVCETLELDGKLEAGNPIEANPGLRCW